MGNGGFVNALRLAHRVGGHADGRACTICGTRGSGVSPCDDRHFLPQLFGDERRDRVRQAQYHFQRANQRAAGSALLPRSASLNLHLGNFQVPVAKSVPHKLVNRVGHVVQAVLFKALGHVGLGLL